MPPPRACIAKAVSSESSGVFMVVRFFLKQGRPGPGPHPAMNIDDVRLSRRRIVTSAEHVSANGPIPSAADPVGR
jgi:hypothetical protein